MSDQIAKFMIPLEWKEFSVNLQSVDTWMKANAGDQYCGNQAHGRLELWFLEEPSQDAKDAIAAYWDALHEDSAEATAYRSWASVKADIATKKASGKAKLAQLGLTDEEIAALVG